MSRTGEQIAHRLMPRLDDTMLKDLAIRDRRGAMEVVVEQFRDRLYQHAFFIVKDPQEAYDAVQEVLIKAMREPRFFNPDFHIKAWLFRVTSNLCYNIVRDRRRRSGILESMPNEDTASPTQVDSVQAFERRGEVMSALDHLSREHREILLLRYYDDLTYAEIADVLQIKLGTVMSRLSRARARLGNMLGTDHPLVVDILQPQLA